MRISRKPNPAFAKDNQPRVAAGPMLFKNSPLRWRERFKAEKAAQSAGLKPADGPGVRAE
jgi:hypothetical protein